MTLTTSVLDGQPTKYLLHHHANNENCNLEKSSFIHSFTCQGQHKQVCVLLFVLFHTVQCVQYSVYSMYIHSYYPLSLSLLWCRVWSDIKPLPHYCWSTVHRLLYRRCKQQLILILKHFKDLIPNMKENTILHIIDKNHTIVPTFKKPKRPEQDLIHIK